MAQSARGLFRATGKSAKVDRPREAEDFYATPWEPIDALLRTGEVPQRVWEPACGDGALAKQMALNGIDVVASDMVDRGFPCELRSFYDFDSAPVDAIVTNPPYCEINWRDGKGRWAWHAFDTLKIRYMALLLNWDWAGAVGHKKLWAEHPPARVYLMRWKIDFTGAGAPPQRNAWFVWDSDWVGEPVMRVLDRPKKPLWQDMLG